MKQGDLILLTQLRELLERGDLSGAIAAPASELVSVLNDAMRDEQDKIATQPPPRLPPGAPAPAGHIGPRPPAAPQQPMNLEPPARIGVGGTDAAPPQRVGVTQEPGGRFRVNPGSPAQEALARGLQGAIDWLAGQKVAGDIAPRLMELALEVDRERRELADAFTLLEYFWAVVANVSGGDWRMQPEAWQQAAAHARDRYHKMIEVTHATQG